MPRTDVRRIVFKLAVLIAMIGALFYRSDTRAQFGGSGCDNDYQYCTTQCSDQYPPGSDAYNNCVHGIGGCDSSYFECWGNDNPPMAQPQIPCPPCLAECDLFQQQCLADGTRTPQQCAYTTYRCKQRCNYYCIY
jgi:hypothetical protein